MEKVAIKFNSFEEHEAADIEYWKSLSGERKLEILEAIRAQYWVMKNEHPRGLQRVCRIIKRS